MAYRSFSLMPTLGNSLLDERFSQMDSLFSRLTGEKPLSDTPSYNLIKINEKHELTISVPGYAQNELDVSVLNNQLTIRGKPQDAKKEEAEEKEKGIKWIHRGIRKNEFSLSFTLEHRIIIQKADLANGLLTLHFNYDIPEQEKPQQITIGGVKNPTSRVLEHHST